MPTPSNAELLAAVRTFLEDEAAPQLHGRPAYLAKVAAKAVAMVERSLLGPAVPALATDLSAQIRAGTIDETTPGLIAQLRAATLAQLAIDNPKYSTLLRHSDT